MTTPVDIDKLKELLARTTLCISADLSYEPSEYVVQMVYGPAGGIIRGCAEAEYIGALVNAAPTLIAKAERVDAMEAALKPFAAFRLSTEGEVSDCVLRTPAAEARRHADAIERRDAEILVARNALFPKESE